MKIEINRESDMKAHFGLSTVNGLSAQQHHGAFEVFHDFVKEVRPKRILEIGTALGGFIEFIFNCTKYYDLNTEIWSYDIYRNSWYDDFVKKGINVRVENIFSDDYTEVKQEVIDFIKSDGTTIILCDGGNKKKEFEILSKFMKDGDYILAHDYCENREIFEEKIKGKIWDWLEISNEDIINSCNENNLKYYKKDFFESVVWTCRVKGDVQVTDNRKTIFTNDKVNNERKKLIIHQPTNFYSKNIRYHSIFWNDLIDELSKKHDVITDRYQKDCHKGIGNVKLELDESDSISTLNVLECEMIIEDYDTGETKILSCADDFTQAVLNLKDNPKVTQILYSQFIPEKISSMVSGHLLHKYQPWIYFPFNKFDLDYFYEQRQLKKNNLIDKMFFSGDLGSRPFVSEFDRNYLDGLGYVGDFENYANTITNYKLALSVAGRGELCYRDVECMAMGIPMIRFEYFSKLNPELIPNYHYISVDRPDDFKNWGMLDRLGNKSHSDVIVKKFLQVKDFKEFLDFISANAKRYYEEYLSPENSVKHTIKLLGL
jgi:hypothetical protein